MFSFYYRLVFSLWLGIGNYYRKWENRYHFLVDNVKPGIKSHMIYNPVQRLDCKHNLIIQKSKFIYMETYMCALLVRSYSMFGMYSIGQMFPHVLMTFLFIYLNFLFYSIVYSFIHLLWLCLSVLLVVICLYFVNSFVFNLLHPR